MNIIFILDFLNQNCVDVSDFLYSCCHIAFQDFTEALKTLSSVMMELHKCGCLSCLDEFFTSSDCVVLLLISETMEQILQRFSCFQNFCEASDALSPSS
jgi:hypothetical protein